jgi:uncharacterized membrane protein YvlD (DUF360 family)
VYIASQVLSGVITYVGGFQTLFMASLVLAAVNLVVRPIINLLLLPIHLVTLGVFRWVANVATLFAMTRLVSNFMINPFSFGGLNLTYVIIPPIHFSTFGAFLYVTLVLTLVFHFLYWLLQD